MTSNVLLANPMKRGLEGSTVREPMPGRCPSTAYLKSVRERLTMRIIDSREEESSVERL
jgi:hypothetical protein